MTTAVIVFGLMYCIVIGALYAGCTTVSLTTTTAAYRPEKKFSIVVPFRNEENALPRLLASLARLRYPENLVEIIFVNDGSQDASVDTIRKAVLSFPYVILENQRRTASPKKDAIVTAISRSKMEWIITTDADCMLPELWLSKFNDFILEHRPRMVAAPVLFTSDGTFLQNFQQLEMAALQGATIGGFGLGRPFMCNGANLGYEKTLFESLSGFAGNEKTASGDDVFLLHKAVADGQKVMFLKSADAVVETNPAQNLREWTQQRIRWVAKSSGYRNPAATLVALVVFFGNLATCLAIALLLFDLATGKMENGPLLPVVFLKFLVDGILIRKSTRFFAVGMSGYPVMALLYPFVSTYVAVRSVFGKYEWKGRKFTR